MIKEKYGDKKQMEDIKRFLEYNSEEYTTYEYEGRLDADTDSIKFLFIAPHSGTDNRWLFRASTIAAFDRWANSSGVEEFFDTEKELCDYLYNHMSDIYMNLIKYLSNVYTELE